MTTPCSGAISLNDVRVELGRSNITSLNDSDVRTLASKTSGIIKLSDLYCKSDSISGWVNALDPVGSGTDKYYKMSMTNNTGYPNFKIPSNFPGEAPTLYKVFDNNSSTSLITWSNHKWARGGGSRQISCGSSCQLQNARVKMKVTFENQTSNIQPFPWSMRIAVGYSSSSAFFLNTEGAQSPATFVDLVYNEGASADLSPNQIVTVDIDEYFALAPVVVGSVDTKRWLAISFDFNSGNDNITNTSLQTFIMDFYVSNFNIV